MAVKPVSSSKCRPPWATKSVRGPCMVRVLIVDDEAPSRNRLRQMVSAIGDFEIVGEAETGTQAMEMIECLKPDLVLLDIQMPGCSGIDVAASLPRPRPNIIFCTAYEEHAVD